MINPEQISRVTGAYVPSYWEEATAFEAEIRAARERGEVHWHDATYGSNAPRVATIEEIINGTATQDNAAPDSVDPTSTDTFARAD